MSDMNTIGELIEPTSIAYSFNTLGWYLLLGLLFFVLLLWAFVKWRKYRRDAYRREGVAAVNRSLTSDVDNAFYEINKLLKIMAIELYGRREVADLYGTEWFSFLVSTLDEKVVCPPYDFKMFADAIYTKNTNAKLSDFSDFALLWINNHHR